MNRTPSARWAELREWGAVQGLKSLATSVRPAGRKRAPSGPVLLVGSGPLPPPPGCGIPRAFTLVELLIVIAVIAVLAAVLFPALHAGTAEARAVRCSANLQQIGIAFQYYAFDNNSAAMPAAYFDDATVTALGGPLYWWGLSLPAGVDHTRGLLWRYLQSPLEEGGLYECPNQPWGTYSAQGQAHARTSTYGYNAYFLSPAAAPGWASDIRQRPWQRLDHLRDPARLLAFGDALAEIAGAAANSALLDPPSLYFSSTRSWRRNRYPNNAFRHRQQTIASLADGHVDRYRAVPDLITNRLLGIGAMSRDNDPWYVPDWRSW